MRLGVFTGSAKMVVLPFDCHNHVHMGPSDPLDALLPVGAARDAPAALGGMAIMSTQPSDFERVHELAKELPKLRPGTEIVECFGVHPWFLHNVKDWEIEKGESRPRWLIDLEDVLLEHPSAVVGEIGLDGFHFDGISGKLCSPMDRQVEAFELQLELASRYDRPVSIHAVQAFGQLMECLSRVKKKSKLPPRIYFHAFGGKSGTVDQLLALCGREPGRVYFGFASVINFRSPKTADLVRKIGLERLVLETDHEDAKYVPASIVECIDFLAAALHLKPAHVIEQTTLNARDLYGLDA